MATPSILIVPDRYKSGVLYSQLPESGAVDFGVTRATTAYRTNASGVLESVASGVPRLDYPASGGCPALLVEPAATNLALRSEEFDDAAWPKTSVTVSANSTSAPDGATTADTIAETAVANNFRINANSNISITSGVTYTASVFLKKGNGATAPNIMQLTFAGLDFGTTQYANFNINTGVVGTVGAGAVARIQNFGNGWYRCSITATATATNASSIGFIVSFSNNDDSLGRLPSYTGVATSNVFAWGAQLETGSVATSYIPTVAATVTRNADVITKTGVSGFIGQTEGTIYAEVNVNNFTNLSRIFAISDGTSNNRIMILFNTSNRIRVIVDQNGGAAQADISSSTLASGNHKIAVGYSNNDVVFYIDGSLVGSDNTASIPACSNIYLGKVETSASTNFLNDRIRAAAIYPVRLSNTELAALTTL